MIQSSDRELAELRFGSGHGQKKTTKNNNKSRAEQEPRSAHGRAVNNKSRVKQEPRSAHGRAVNKKKIINPVQSKNRARPMAARLITNHKYA